MYTCILNIRDLKQIEKGMSKSRESTTAFPLETHNDSNIMLSMSLMQQFTNDNE